MTNFVKIIYNQNPLYMIIRRFAIAIVLGLFVFSPQAYGQMTFTVSEETATAGGTVDVDITVADFTDITVFEFGLNWDSLVLEVESIPFVNTDLQDFDLNGIAYGDQIDSLGRLTSNFFRAQNGQDLEDGTTLFTIRFNILGAECDSTLLTFDPSGNIYSDFTFSTFDLGTVDGKVNVDGTDCNGGGGGTELTTTASHEEVGVGAHVCVPITVKNFHAIEAGAKVGTGQGDMFFDESIITYTGIENQNLPTMFSLNDANATTGKVKFLWFTGNINGIGIELDDDDVLFEICFDAIGAVGDVSPINLVDWEWTDDSDESNDIPDVEVAGSVTIVGAMLSQFTLSISDTEIAMDEEGCVDVTVGGFTDINVLEHRVKWDDSVVRFGSIADDIRAINLSGLNNNLFNYVDGNDFFTLSWSNGPGVILDDNTIIYKICFEAIGDCEEESAIEILPNNGSSIVVAEVINNISIGIPASRITTNDGNITIGCEEPCSLGPIQGTCPGEEGGSITIVTGAGATCTWTNAAGEVVSNDCNLLGVGAGNYTMNATFSGGETCMLSGTVPQLDAPLVDGTTVDAGCGTGSITATITNVNGTLTFSWDDASIGNTLTPTGLEAGDYTLTAGDDGVCVGFKTFTISAVILPLVLTYEATDILCNGDNTGSINLGIQGGCAPYAIMWDGGLSGENPMNIAIGTYGVTVTDDKGTVVSESIEIKEPPSLTLASQNVTESTGSDGSISIVVSGGTGAYDYSWTPGPLANSNTVSGLAPGSYTVVVTDAMGCEANFGPFVVIDTSGGDPKDSIFVQGVNSLCFGEATGQIVVDVAGNSFPGSLTIVGVSADQTQNVAASGSFTFSTLLAGAYTVTYTNADGMPISKDVTVSNPIQLEFDLDPDKDIGCENESQADGFIDIETEGGTGNLTYVWGDPDLSGSSVNNLSAGIYTVIVTDANGCDIMGMFTILKCDTMGKLCYEFPQIITPNGDGRNDVFAASCLRDFPAELTVYDRWGSEVFNMLNYDGTWNGVNQRGVDLIEGGYMWVLDIAFTDGRRELMKGTVTILRD